jgi:hypothetical protein
VTEDPRVASWWYRLQALQWILAFALPATSMTLARPAEIIPLLLLGLHGVPFVIAALLMKHVERSGSNLRGMLGATGLAFLSTVLICVWLAWRVTTGWHGGADIGLGLALLAYPLLIGPIMLMGFAAGVSLSCQPRGRITRG